MSRPPDTEYFSFELKYTKSTYRSEDHGGYFNTWREAKNESERIIRFHKKTIEDIGDIFLEPNIIIYRVTAIEFHGNK